MKKVLKTGLMLGLLIGGISTLQAQILHEETVIIKPGQLHIDSDAGGGLPFKIWAGGTGNYNHLRIGTDMGHYGDAVMELYQNYSGGSSQQPGRLIVNGKMGIGTTNPSATLEIADKNGTGLDTRLKGFTLIDGAGASLLFGSKTTASHGEWAIEYNQKAKGLNFWKPYGGTTGYAGTNYHLFINYDGKVSMGLDPTVAGTFKGDYKLYVAKGILTEKLKVSLRNTNEWADYVFADDYELMPLNDVEKFVAENNHLPGIPSADEVKESGIDVAKMDAKLLEKIEELTLYIIDLEKKFSALEKKVTSK